MAGRKRDFSLATICFTLKVSYTVVVSSMARGLSFDEAVKHAQSLGYFDGSTHHPSADMYYTANNLGAGVARFRRRSKWDAGSVLETPIRGTTGAKVFYRGRDYKSRSALCRAYGISIRFIDRLVKDYHYDFLILFTFAEVYFRKFRPNKEPFSRCPYVIVDGEWYWTRSAFALALGVSETAFGTALMKHDYDIPQCLSYLRDSWDIPAGFFSVEIIPCYRQFYGMLTALCSSGAMVHWFDRFKE